MGYRFDPVAFEEEAADENFFVRYWRGHISLATSWFLVGGLLSTGLVGILSVGVVAIENSTTSLQLVAAAWLAFFAFFVAIRVWATVGIWRSAGFHEARGGRPFWASLARFLLVLGVLATLAQARNYGLQVAEYGQLATGHDPIGSLPKLTKQDSAQEIKLDGLLVLGTAAHVEQMAAGMPKLRAIQLESLGGRIFEAQRLADFVRARGLATRVESHCESACTLVLLAGKDRTAAMGARVGFHQPDFPGLTEADRQTAISSNSQQYIEAGIDRDFVAQMMQTPPAQMWYPTHQELIEAGVIDGGEIVVGSDPSEDPLGKRLVWEAAELRRSLPIKLDYLTVLEDAEARGHEVVLKHRLQRTVDTAQMKAGKPSLARDIRKNACGDDRTRELIDVGATLNYRYEQVNGRYLFEIPVSSCD